MSRTITDGVSKIEIVERENDCIVQYFELMGNKWAPLGEPEIWSKELAFEEF
jgi:hypothetical protein